MTEYIIELPPLYYFECGNDFTGSHGDMSFKIAAGDEMSVSVWHGRLCSAKADILETRSFERSDDGYSQMRGWLDEKSAE